MSEIWLKKPKLKVTLRHFQSYIMRVVRMRKLVLLLVFFIAPSFAGVKPNVRVVFSDALNPTQTTKHDSYKKIIQASLGKHYELKFSTMPALQPTGLKDDEYADIIIEERSTTVDNDFLYSENHIDKRHAIYLIYDVKHVNFGVDTPSKNHTFALTNDTVLKNTLPKNAGLYQVKDITNIYKLIENKRIDGIVTYSYNVHLADPKQQLQTIEFRPSTKLFLKFHNNSQGQQIAKDFDSEMSSLIATHGLKKYFPELSDYIHADFSENEKVSKVMWHIIPKKYNTVSRRLEPLKHELGFSKYLTQQMSDFNFDIEVNSSRLVLDAFKTNSTHCALNISKTPERELSAYFSVPSYVFLSPRLLTLDSNTQLKIQLNNDHNISLDQVLDSNNQARIAIVKGGNTDKALSRDLTKDTLNRLYKVEDVSLVKVLTMLLTKRVEAVIAWPSHVPNIIDNQEVAKHINSYAINELHDKNFFSYIACSRNNEGNKIIDEVNNILKTPSHTQTLFEPMLKTMDKDSASEFMRVLLLPKSS